MNAPAVPEAENRITGPRATTPSADRTRRGLAPVAFGHQEAITVACRAARISGIVAVAWTLTAEAELPQGMAQAEQVEARGRGRGRSCHMPNDDASGRQNWRAARPEPRLRRWISPVIRGAREPTEPSGARACATVRLRTMARHLSTNSSGNAGLSSGRGPAWCDAIRNRRSASLPNAPTIGQTSHGRNPTVNCEKGPLSRHRQARPTDTPHNDDQGLTTLTI